MKFSKRLFLIAGIYGLLVVLPQYFLEEKNGRDFPPPITHPEYYYGFIGVTLAWQVLYLILSRDPKRYRGMIIPAVIAKGSFVIAVVALFLKNRIPFLMLVVAVPDLIFVVLFLIAYVRLRSDPDVVL
jgi:hypothetical protein